MDSTQLYRHWDIEGRLLYVGISYSSVSRLRQHEKKARWFKLVNSVTIEHFSNRREAEIAEMTAIKAEKPIYNIVGAVSRVVEGKPQKKMKWSRCTYKIKGKRVFSIENIPTYKAILDMLELGKTDYDVNFDKEITRDIQDIVRLTPEEIRVGNSIAAESLQLLRGLASTSDKCVTIYVNDRVLPIFIEARDNNDIFLGKEYWIPDKEDNRGKLNFHRQVYPNWYFLNSRGLTGDTNE